MLTAIIDGQALEVSEALLAKYNRPGPRYTSYPTAPAWTDAFGPDDYRAAVQDSNAAARPLSVYLHLPFCESHCTFCGCNVIITKQRAVVDPYLDDIERELALVGEWVDRGRRVAQLHFGGGTPTYLGPHQLRRLMQTLRGRFVFAADAELGVEVDPRVTSVEHLEVLREFGFNRISMGIQDFHPATQVAVNRIQPAEPTGALIARCRALGFTSVNVDLIYGLPHQTVAAFADTIRLVVGMQPDRIACYNFAFVPWIKAQQRHIDPSTLPDPAVKLALLGTAMTGFAAAGYRFIGMDHFALPDDELSRALDAGTLWRNFQGYTTKAGTDLLAFGITGISDVAGRYAQNVKPLAAYRRALADGHAPVERGCTLRPADLLRRRVIRDLLCRNAVDRRTIAREFAIDFDEEFRDAIDGLRPFRDDGLVELTAAAIVVTPLGRLFVRNIAMTFDQYLPAESSRPLYSQTV